MKKQDILTPVGMLLGISLMVFAIAKGEVGLAGFYDFISIIITVGGSFAAVLITFPLEEVKLLIGMTKSLFTTPSMSKIETIETRGQIRRLTIELIKTNMKKSKHPSNRINWLLKSAITFPSLWSIAGNKSSGNGIEYTTSKNRFGGLNGLRSYVSNYHD